MDNYGANMNKLAMRFTVVRFMPYVQTREFANIGIILTCPKTGYFNYIIEHKYARLSKFFNKFDSSVYKAVINAFKDELDRVKEIAESSTPEQIRGILDHIARPREAVILTSEVAVTTGDIPHNEMERLFNYYVGHSFAKEYHDTQLTRHIEKLVKNIKNINPFKEILLGEKSGFHTTFPLVQQADNGDVLKIIKPIYLGHQDPSEIYNKSDSWIARINRLNKLNILDDAAIMFAYQPPENPNEGQKKALNIILNELKSANIQTANERDKDKIISFASSRN